MELLEQRKRFESFLCLWLFSRVLVKVETHVRRTVVILIVHFNIILLFLVEDLPNIIRSTFKLIPQRLQLILLDFINLLLILLSLIIFFL